MSDPETPATGASEQEAPVCYRHTDREAYIRILVTRGIGDWLGAFVRIDESLGFHPSCPFGNERLPCMIALVRDIVTDAPIAIHRTALDLSGASRRV